MRSTSLRSAAAIGAGFGPNSQRSADLVGVDGVLGHMNGAVQAGATGCFPAFRNMAVMLDQAALARDPRGEPACFFRHGDEIFMVGNLRIRAHSVFLIADLPLPATPRRAGGPT